MTGRAFKRKGVLSTLFLIRGGGLGEGWVKNSTGPEGWRMTGSAQTWSEAVRFILLLGEKKKERVWERKGLGIGPDGKLADFYFGSFSVRRGSPDALHTASIFM